MISEKLEQLIRKIVLEETTKIKHGKLTEEKKYEMFRNGTTMEFRKKTNNGLIGTVEMEETEIGNRLPDSGYLKLAAGVSKPYKNKMELHDLVNGMINESALKEEKYKLSKGNKFTKNSFGDGKLKDTNSNPRQEFEDYPISYEEAIEKLKGIKDMEKLDREYERLFAQMNNSHERNLLMGYYKILRDNITQMR